MKECQHVTILVDLGYGDAGKGTITDYLARRDGAGTVVRFNGGAQAAHNVVTPDGRHHAFHQFGSATFVPGTRTHLSRFMLVSPLRLWQEAEDLAALGVPDALDRITIDEDALVISPYQEAANRIREALRGEARHGSCGLGIGETMADSLDRRDEVLTVRDLADQRQAVRKLEALRERKRAEFEASLDSLRNHPDVAQDVEALSDPRLSEGVAEFYAALSSRVRIVGGDHLGRILDEGQVIFEGAQGVLLDEWYGFHPYTTWSTTTCANADLLLKEQGYTGPVARLGLLRGYATRHGAGPFVTEDARLSRLLPDPHNPLNPWQQDFRVGSFDLVASRYALEVTGPLDGLVLTNLDRLVGQVDWSFAREYETGDGRVVTRLPRSPVPDLDHQERLTEMLSHCRPVLEPITDGPFGEHHLAEYTEHIEKELSLPVVLTSTGPTALDKSVRPWAEASRLKICEPRDLCRMSRCRRGLPFLQGFKPPSYTQSVPGRAY